MVLVEEEEAEEEVEGEVVVIIIHIMLREGVGGEVALQDPGRDQ